MKKVLNFKSFWIVLSGIVVTLVYNVVDLIKNHNREYSALRERMDADRFERLTKAISRLNFVSFIIFALICAYFIYRLVKNKKQSQGQKYITFLFVVNIVSLVFCVISLLMGEWIVLLDIVANILIIIGCSMQKNYEFREEI